MPNDLLADVQFKARSGAQVTVDKAEGIVECFVAGIGNKDSVGDIVLPGAFTESLKRRKPRVVWGHSWNDPIGKVLEIYEVPNSDSRLPSKMKSAGIGGLFAKVQFNLGAEKGREAFANVAFFGEEQEWSIGYKTLQASFDPIKQANMLKEVELYEVSPVLHGANQLTGTISVKDGEYGACGLNGCDCGTKTMEAEPETAEEAVVFEKGFMMGRMPMLMIPLPMPNKPEGHSDHATSEGDIWSRGEAGPIDMEARIALAKEIHGRTKVPIKIVEASENMVVFLRKMVDQTTRMYRMPYHKTDDGKYTFGKPARVKPQTMYSPISTPGPPNPLGHIHRKPNPNPILGKDPDTKALDPTVVESNLPILIPCGVEQLFEAKAFLEPVLDYYDVDATPTGEGLLLTYSNPDFRDAAETAIKALGGKLGRGGGLGKARRAGRALQLFDPDAWDGDNDGLVQEGTPFERPSIPGINTNLPGQRHTRRKPKGYARDDRNRDSGDALPPPPPRDRTPPPPPPPPSPEREITRQVTPPPPPPPPPPETTQVTPPPPPPPVPRPDSRRPPEPGPGWPEAPAEPSPERKPQLALPHAGTSIPSMTPEERRQQLDAMEVEIPAARAKADQMREQATQARDARTYFRGQGADGKPRNRHRPGSPEAEERPAPPSPASSHTVLNAYKVREEKWLDERIDAADSGRHFWDQTAYQWSAQQGALREYDERGEVAPSGMRSRGNDPDAWGPSPFEEQKLDELLVQVDEGMPLGELYDMDGISSRTQMLLEALIDENGWDFEEDGVDVNKTLAELLPGRGEIGDARSKFFAAVEDDFWDDPLPFMPGVGGPDPYDVWKDRQMDEGMRSFNREATPSKRFTEFPKDHRSAPIISSTEFAKPQPGEQPYGDKPNLGGTEIVRGSNNPGEIHLEVLGGDHEGFTRVKIFNQSRSDLPADRGPNELQLSREVLVPSENVTLNAETNELEWGGSSIYQNSWEALGRSGGREHGKAWNESGKSKVSRIMQPGEAGAAGDRPNDRVRNRAGMRSQRYDISPGDDNKWRVIDTANRNATRPEVYETREEALQAAINLDRPRGRGMRSFANEYPEGHEKAKVTSHAIFSKPEADYGTNPDGTPVPRNPKRREDEFTVEHLGGDFEGLSRVTHHTQNRSDLPDSAQASGQGQGAWEMSVASERLVPTDSVIFDQDRGILSYGGAGRDASTWDVYGKRQDNRPFKHQIGAVMSEGGGGAEERSRNFNRGLARDTEQRYRETGQSLPKGWVPSGMRSMGSEQRRNRIDDINPKLETLNQELMATMSRPDADASRIDEMLSIEGRLRSERHQLRQAQQLHSLESGKRSRVRAKKPLEMNLTEDEIGSLRSDLRSMIAATKDKDVKGSLANYDSLLANAKNGKVKVPVKSYDDIVKNWEKVSPGDVKNRKIHPKTGRDILEFAALDKDSKFTSPGSKKGGTNAYSGFRSSRINNGAPPEITPRMQRDMLTGMEAGKRPGGGHDSMIHAMAEDRNGSPKQWAMLESHHAGMRSSSRPTGQFDRGKVKPSNIDTGKKARPGRPMGFEPEEARFKGKKFAEMKPDGWDEMSTQDKWDLLHSELLPSRSGMREVDHSRISREVGKKLDMEERRDARKRGEFPSLAERRARRELNPPARVEKRRKPDRDPSARKSPQDASKERKKNLDRLDKVIGRQYNDSSDAQIEGGVGPEHTDFWAEMADVVTSEEDLTFSQLERMEGLLDGYIAGGNQMEEMNASETAAHRTATALQSEVAEMLEVYRDDPHITQGSTAGLGFAGTDPDIDPSERGDAQSIFEGGGMRSIRRNQDAFKTNAVQEYVSARRQQGGMRSIDAPSKAERIDDLRNLWRNARSGGDEKEMRRLEAEMEDLGVGPSRGTVRPASTGSSRRTGGNWKTRGESSGMRSEQAGRTQINHEATFFKRVEGSLDKEIREAKKRDDNKTAIALTLLQKVMRRQESGKTGDKRTNAGTVTVNQEEVDQIMDGLMSVLDRQVDTGGSRTEMFAELLEMFAASAMATFISKTTEEIMSRTPRRRSARS
ncbi:MAG: hypothetical protein CL489_01835 [Acidobacteria bacterium]|nr:hypothetical protein [Acidobacteriota bacterium]